MNYFGFLCMGGVEVANANRVSDYIRAGYLGPNYNAYCEPCAAIEEDDDITTYFSPSVDDAPWYDPTVWASDEFYGIVPSRIEVLPVLGRSMSPRVGDGGFLTPVTLRPRVLQFSGILIAANDRGMAYGEHWLSEVLMGTRCADGCRGDEVLVLPACPEPGYEPEESAFRRLLGAGVTDGPNFVPLGNFPEGKVSTVTFQLAASYPYKFGLAETLLSGTVTGYSPDTCVAIGAPSWATATGVITLTAATDAEDIQVTGRRAVGGNCPPTVGEACFQVDIPTLPEDGAIIIDGTRREVRYYDPSSKVEGSGLSMLTLDGPVTYPDVASCSELCICVTVGSGTVEVDVDRVLREV